MKGVQWDPGLLVLENPNPNHQQSHLAREKVSCVS